jgi:hypothetical protein
MHVLEGGRKAFLEFLRNMTPQILLLALALTISTRLNFHEFDASNTPTTFFFFSLVFLAVIGMAANSVNFFAEYCHSLTALDAAVATRLKAGNRTWRRLLRVTFAEAWKLRKGMALELAFSLLAVNSVMLAVVIGAIFQGSGFLRALR